MGNSIGGRKRVKVMKVDGEILKLKLPIRVSEVLKDYPDHVLMESEAVKHYGVKAKPLEPQQDLNRKKIYFLLQLPKIAADNRPPPDRIPRRVRSSGVHMSAKDRLDLLMLSRRTMSEIAITRPSTTSATDSSAQPRFHSGPMQVKMKIPRSQVAKLMEESASEGEIAEKIIKMYLKNEVNTGGGSAGDVNAGQHPEHWKPSLVSSVRENSKVHREKRVSFLPMDKGEIHLAVADNQQ
ncbi:uncharacterized protein At1g66480 [Cucumis sativus]|uniref:uncharacterized protein At1g66480 n=1 Tax=Cucumis sativus TaxID=3659 RepID=UPI0002B460A7|nr:uncharacterized protein At1g66480 [Cucumis sativus]KAE8648427.1 hypothetical protein Csa_008184 [Cucumis sativus]